MNTGQSMLAIGAIILLSVIILNVNNGFLTTNDSMMDSKFGILATSLAESIILEANNKAFDEHTANGNTVLTVNNFTSPDSLGPDNGETFSNFNDFDDFNGYDTTITDLPSAVFNLQCQVFYVNASNLNSPSNSQTWSKKLIVTVTSPSSKDKIVLSTIYSYWFATQ